MLWIWTLNSGLTDFFLYLKPIKLYDILVGIFISGVVLLDPDVSYWIGIHIKIKILKLDWYGMVLFDSDINPYRYSIFQIWTFVIDPLFLDPG